MLAYLGAEATMTRAAREVRSSKALGGVYKGRPYARRLSGSAQTKDVLPGS